MSFNRYFLGIACFLLSNITSAQQLHGVCGTLDNPYGPFDYRIEKKAVAEVERFHFNSGVETLKKGISEAVGAHLDYTLRASPNHHRALMAMLKLGQKEKTDMVYGATYSVQCYMERAERFRPDDAMVKVIYGLYYLDKKEYGNALKKLQEAAALDEINANVSYNLGLAYFELKRYDDALEQAHKAYKYGFPLPGLRNMLKSAGKWKDPEPESTTSGKNTEKADQKPTPDERQKEDGDAKASPSTQRIEEENEPEKEAPQ